MSLRLRLVIIYTVLVGVVIAVFGISAFNSTKNNLQDQIDTTLMSAIVVTKQVFETLDKSLLLTSDTFEISAIPELLFGYSKSIFLSRYGEFVFTHGETVLIQVWDLDNTLIFTAEIEDLPISGQPMAPEALQKVISTGERDTREITQGDLHYRVISDPLYVGENLVGVFQAGRNLEEMDAMLDDLRPTLIIVGVSAVFIASLLVWFSTKNVLYPLEAVTKTAAEIHRADDLSRRIPKVGNPHDEVGKLIQVFNLTLERLENLFRLQRRFIADVGHELRTPLTVIKGNANLMRKLGKMDEQSLNSMEIEINRLTRIVGDLLLIAQAETGNLPLDFREIEVDTILLEIFQQAQVLVGEKKTILIGEIDQVQVCGDRDRIKQVIWNLVGNAIKYTPPKGKIELSLCKHDGMCMIQIADNGPGIPEEDLDHIFERFYRAEKSRSRHIDEDEKGFGLGLSISYWIVKNHGGNITVDSKLGQGTTFRVLLPMAEKIKGGSKEINPTAAGPERIS